MEIIIDRNRVIVQMTDDEDYIGTDVKPAVVDYIRKMMTERESLFAERDSIDRRQQPQEFKVWIAKYQTWGLEVNEKANKLQFS